MSIHWSRPLLADLLPTALLDRVRQAQVDPSYDPAQHPSGYVVPFYNAKTGKHIVDIPMKDAVRVSRKKMRALCAEGIDIQYGKKLVSLTPSLSGITATFQDNSTATGSICIGADGAQSTVRQIALGDSGLAKPMDVVLYNVNVCYGDAEKARQVRQVHFMNSVALQPEQNMSVWTSIQDVPDPDHPETWQFQIMPTWLADNNTTVQSSGSAALAELKSKALSLADPWKSSILWIPDDTPVSCNRVSYWPTIPWDSQHGTITLAGDSAHPVPPHRGQGLNHGIADATNFVKAVIEIRDGNKSREEAIMGYNEELVRRGADEVETSRRNALLVHDFEKFMDSPVLKQGYTKSKVPSN
ncbi:hypothetical protein F5884DRAFT_785833 [Xylogone sp. PMI_703]|nr:hypothetical protein F5884DRAFT_785833 [Xylogone sp. PMI_703]